MPGGSVSTYTVHVACHVLIGIGSNGQRTLQRRREAIDILKVPNLGAIPRWGPNDSITSMIEANRCWFDNPNARNGNACSQPASLFLLFPQNSNTDDITAGSIYYRLVRGSTLHISFYQIMYIRMTLASLPRPHELSRCTTWRP